MNCTNEQLQMLHRLKKSNEGNDFINFLESQYVICLTNVLKASGDDLIVAKGKALCFQDLLTTIKTSDTKLQKQSDKEAKDTY
jgi:hypothetical protein